MSNIYVGVHFRPFNAREMWKNTDACYFRSWTREPPEQATAATENFFNRGKLWFGDQKNTWWKLIGCINNEDEPDEQYFTGHSIFNAVVVAVWAIRFQRPLDPMAHTTAKAALNMVWPYYVIKKKRLYKFEKLFNFINLTEHRLRLAAYGLGSSWQRVKSAFIGISGASISRGAIQKWSPYLEAQSKNDMSVLPYPKKIYGARCTGFG